MSAAITIEKLGVEYGRRVVLAGVDATLPRGALVGVVGPNGAGKTTLFRAALGLIPAHGSIHVMGKELASYGSTGLARIAAYLPQGAKAQWPIFARDLVALGRLPHRPALAPLSNADMRAVEGALERCDARVFSERRMNELSAGEAARVLLARALATEAQILIADEPAAFLDPAHQIQLMELLREEARRGLAVAVTLHDLSLAARYCDEVIVLEKGRLAVQGNPDDALSDAVLARVFSISATRFTAASGATVLAAWQRL